MDAVVDESVNDSANDNMKKDVYYLASSNRPGPIITHVQLKNDNYDKWAKAMKLSLRSNRKLGFINGLITKLEGTD